MIPSETIQTKSQSTPAQETFVSEDHAKRHGFSWLRQNGGLIAVWIVLLLECVLVSARKPFWFDEILTYRLAVDRSFAHMMAAMKDRFNVSPPVYHLLCWFWVRGPGSPTFSLRLLSALCFCGAFGLLWAMLRPRFGILPTTAALSVVLTTAMLGNYNAEARNYGLYTLLCALALYQYDRRLSAPKFGAASFFANVLTHAGLVLTHLFGFLYGGAILIALFVQDIRQRKFRVDFYASVSLGWLLFFLVWGRTMRFQMGAFKPYSWVSLPHLYQLLSVLVLHDRRLILVLAGIAALSVFFLIVGKRRGLSPPSANGQTPAASSDSFPLLLAAATTLFFPPIAAYLASYAVAPVFVDRYLLPGILAWIIFLAFAFSRLRQRFADWKAAAGAPAKASLRQADRLLGVVAVVALVYALYAARKTPLPNDYLITYRQVVDQQEQATGLPIVCDNDLDYLALDFSAKHRSQLYFLLDEPAALQSDPSAIGFEMVQFKVMSALRKYYEYPNVQEYDRFLADHNQFLVLLNPQNRWTDIRLKSNPAYVCIPLTVQGCDLLLVRKRGAP